MIKYNITKLLYYKNIILHKITYHKNIISVKDILIYIIYYICLKEYMKSHLI